MSYIRLFHDKTKFNKWLFSYSTKSELASVFAKDKSKEYWKDVSVFKCSTWEETITAAAYHTWNTYRNNKEFRSGCHCIKIPDDVLHNSTLNHNQSSVKSNGKTQTGYNQLDSLHHDLSGSAVQFEDFSHNLYETYNKQNQLILTVTLAELVEGARLLGDTTMIALANATEAKLQTTLR